MSETQRVYDEMNKDYLKCWQSAGKRDVSNFELAFVGGSLDELVVKRAGKISVLEVGVGPGRIASEILKRNVDYFGIDVSEKMLEEFKKVFGGNEKIKQLAQYDISQSMPFGELSFDAVVAIRVLYYSENWQEVLGSLAKKINSGGRIIFTMLNKYSSAQLGKIYKDGLTGHYSSYKELVGLLERIGFENIKIRGYARVPDVIYDLARSDRFAGLLRLKERILTVLFGKRFLMRMFYISADKK